MNEPQSSPKTQPAWLSGIILVLLCAQLALIWVQGRQLQQQNHEIRGLKDEMQMLIEALEQGNTLEGDGALGESGPTAWRMKKGRTLQPVHYQEPENKESEEKKELEESRQSAQKAVKDARGMREKLSLEENARKAEEKKKLQDVQNNSSRWIFLGLGIAFIVFVYLAWQRRRSI